jgi:hypothetical protein
LLLIREKSSSGTSTLPGQFAAQIPMDLVFRLGRA